MTEKLIDVGGYHLRAVEQGEGPLVLMIHGFPGLAWSWRHQMEPLAQAGFRAVAIDSLGYGGSDRPTDPAAYDADRMQAYLIALLDHYEAEKAVIVGQDFGAQYAWNLAVRAPDRVAGLIATIPYDYDMAGRAMLGSTPPGQKHPPLTASPANASPPWPRSISSISIISWKQAPPNANWPTAPPNSSPASSTPFHQRAISGAGKQSPPSAAVI